MYEHKNGNAAERANESDQGQAEPDPRRSPAQVPRAGEIYRAADAGRSGGERWMGSIMSSAMELNSALVGCEITFDVRGNAVIMDVSAALLFVGVAWFVGSNGYLRVSRPGYGEQYVHRIIIDASDGDEVDHINGNKLDNRACNLRLVTHSQNMCNAAIRSHNKTGVTGVRWDKARKQWAAQIAINNKTIPLGRFNVFEHAVAARVAAEEKYHGEYARRG